MLLIIAHPWDAAAISFYHYCRDQAGLKTKFINADTLSSSFSWKFRFNEVGETTLSFKLYTGEWVHDSEVSAVFNRMQFADAGIWRMASEKEQNYAQQEFHAFFLGWLQSFGTKLLNPPTPAFLSGETARPVVWRKKAYFYDIPVLSSTQDSKLPLSDETVPEGVTGKTKIYLVGDQVIGHIKGLPPNQVLTRFSREQAFRFSELSFLRQHKTWKLDTITTFPENFHSSHQCMEALYQYFLSQQNSKDGTYSRHPQRATRAISA